MAVLAVSDRQVDPTFQAADVAGDSFVNDGSTELLVLNPGPSSITVTAVGTRRCSHGFLDNWVKTVDAGELLRFGPFESSWFNTPAGVMSVSYSSATGISVSAQRQR